jgi:curli biogenesis system outer membrane secretion channel CsgG
MKTTKLLALAASAIVSGCSGIPLGTFFGQGSGSFPVLPGASVTENRTPVDDALVCYGAALSQERGRRAPLSVAVGEVRDFTGRVTEGEGAPVTQGAGLMVYSALANVGPPIRIHERLDPRIAELELAYLERRQLGDGRMHEATPGASPAPWLPYMGGSILQTDYYIVGGVTELNYVLSTGGFEASISGFGARSRYITINVAVDLRIVNSRNLVVEHAVSMQKQVIGSEAGVDIFRFFGNRLFDISGGARMSEPMQMAVRSVLQLATLDLLEAVSGVPNETCVRKVQSDVTREQPRPRPPVGSRSWPPDSKTAVSADRVREAAREVSAAPAPEPAPGPIQTPAPSEEPRADRAPVGAVVIAAAQTEDVAVRQWRELRDAHQDLLGNARGELRRMAGEGGPYVIVVQSTEMPAPDLCAKLQERNVECVIAPAFLAATLGQSEQQP